MSQARRLEGQTFHCYQRNGVVAVARHRPAEFMIDDAERCSLIREALLCIPGSHKSLIDEGLDYFGIEPIFTFANAERFEREPWFTGNYPMYEALLDYIREQGGGFESVAFPRYVPFSNAKERNFGRSREFMGELKYIVTSSQFFDTFGITLAELKSRALTEV